jgi:hypothetical protein
MIPRRRLAATSEGHRVFRGCVEVVFSVSEFVEPLEPCPTLRTGRKALDDHLLQKFCSQEASDRPHADTAEEGGAKPRGTTGRDDTIVGKLLDHGHDRYRFNPREEMSYFVRIETPEGKRTVWGVDLERALSKSLSQPQIGDEIALARTGSEPMTVSRKTRGADGEVLSEEPLATQRHRWRIERTEFLADREVAARMLRDPSIPAKQAIQNRPELAGTSRVSRAAEAPTRSA